MATNQVNPGANFEITVDGTPRSYRDDPLIAVEAAEYLKTKNPTVEVAIRDIRTGEITPIKSTSPKLSVVPSATRR